MNPALTPCREGVLLALRVRPGAPRERIVGLHGERLKVAVRPAPEKGRANEAVLRLLARALGLDRRDLEVRTGHSSPDKAVLIRQTDPRAVADALGRVLAEEGDSP